MAAPSRTIRAALVTLCALPDASGDYTYDLTSSGAVVGSRPPVEGPAKSPPCVYVGPGSLMSRPDGVPLGYFERVAVYDVIGFVAATTGDAGAAEDAAMDLRNDLLTAIEDTRKGGEQMLGVADPQIRDFFIEADAVDGADLDDGYPGGVVLMRVTVSWASRKGG